MPDCVYKMGNLRIVDLTKVLDPKTESRRCHLIRYNTGGPIPDFHTALDLTSHLGTHCECPYHHFEDGKSVGELPLTTFMGRGSTSTSTSSSRTATSPARIRPPPAATGFRRATSSFWTATGSSRRSPRKPTARRISACLSTRKPQNGCATMQSGASATATACPSRTAGGGRPKPFHDIITACRRRVP